MKGNQRVNIKLGMKVAIVLKADQQSGKLTEGVVKDIMTTPRLIRTALRYAW